ncbi:MAG: hypothetical protein IKU20_11065, partial [Lachnospiraceae bacterium]|nr:hypothetical protein [Lachnospiraceae bacterium]
CAAVMLAGKWLVFLPLLVRLMVQILIGVAVYAVLAGVFRLESFRFCRDGLRAMTGGKREEAR